MGIRDVVFDYIRDSGVDKVPEHYSGEYFDIDALYDFCKAHPQAGFRISCYAPRCMTYKGKEDVLFMHVYTNIPYLILTRAFPKQVILAGCYGEQAVFIKMKED